MKVFPTDGAKLFRVKTMGPCRRSSEVVKTELDPRDDGPRVSCTANTRKLASGVLPRKAPPMLKLVQCVERESYARELIA